MLKYCWERLQKMKTFDGEPGPPPPPNKIKIIYDQGPVQIIWQEPTPFLFVNFFNFFFDIKSPHFFWFWLKNLRAEFWGRHALVILFFICIMIKDDTVYCILYYLWLWYIQHTIHIIIYKFVCIVLWCIMLFWIKWYI